MERTETYLAMSLAIDVNNELRLAAAFDAKYDPSLQWDVSYHHEAARVAFVKLAEAFGYRVELVSEMEAA